MIQIPCYSIRIKPEDYLEKNDIWWDMHHYMALKEKPEIFFWALQRLELPLTGLINCHLPEYSSVKST